MAVLGVVAAYLLGSLSFAVIVSRLLGLGDPHSYGSGNPGATNVLRSGSKLGAALTLLLDAGKGWLAVFLAQRLGLDAWPLALVLLAVFLGHLYPVFFRFRGGKGVATAAGALLGVNLLLGLAALLTWLLVLALFRYSSLSALAAALLAPAYYTLGAPHLWQFQWPLLLAIGLMSLGLFWRHRGNITRLMRGQEPRVGARRT